MLRRVAPQLPGALIALILMTIMVTVFGWARSGRERAGHISEGLPRLGLPQVELIDYLRLFPGAIAICGITLADGLLVGRNYAEKRDYPARMPTRSCSRSARRTSRPVSAAR